MQRNLNITISLSYQCLELLSEHKYNLIGSLKNQEDKPKISYGRLPKLFIKKLWLNHTNSICETEQ